MSHRIEMPALHLSQWIGCPPETSDIDELAVLFSDERVTKTLGGCRGPEAVEKILAIGNEETWFIPGHGHVVDYAFMLSYRSMLKTTYERIAKAIADGRTLEETLATNPTAEFDPDFAGFISAEAYIGLVYRDLSKFISLWFV